MGKLVCPYLLKHIHGQAAACPCHPDRDEIARVPHPFRRNGWGTDRRVVIENLVSSTLPPPLPLAEELHQRLYV